MASTDLRRTKTTSSTLTKFTFSAWLKRSSTGVDHVPWGIWIDGDNRSYVDINDEDRLVLFERVSGVSTIVLNTSMKFRDLSAWYHVVVVADTTQATASDRIKFYVNGELITDFSSSTYPSQNANLLLQNNTSTVYVGSVGLSYWNGSMAHIHYIDGTAYDADTFGETDTTTGIWKPKTAPSVTYGTNGFFLKFENSGAFGTDSSGNANNFTVNGTMTQTIDTPSNVFATMNALNTYVPAILSNGNLKISGAGSDGGSASTLGFSSGKWYWEVKYTDEIGGDPVVGIVNSIGANKIKGTTSLSVTSGSGVWCLFNLTSGGVGIQENGVFDSYPSTTLSDGDILNIAVDADNQKLWYGINGTWFNSGDPANGTNATSINLTSGETWFAYLEKRNSSSIADFNFGNGYFGTTKITSPYNDSNGIGLFNYEPPTNFLSLCTKSLNEQEYD